MNLWGNIFVENFPRIPSWLDCSVTWRHNRNGMRPPDLSMHLNMVLSSSALSFVRHRRAPEPGAQVSVVMTRRVYAGQRWGC